MCLENAISLFAKTKSVFLKSVLHAKLKREGKMYFNIEFTYSHRRNLSRLISLFRMFLNSIAQS